MLSEAGLDAPRSSLKHWQEIQSYFKASGRMRPELEQTLDALRPPLLQSGTCLKHGDFNGSQVVSDGQTFAVIDWEGARAGATLGDLGSCVAALKMWGAKERSLQTLREKV